MGVGRTYIQISMQTCSPALILECTRVLSFLILIFLPSAALSHALHPTSNPSISPLPLLPSLPPSLPPFFPPPLSPSLLPPSLSLPPSHSRDLLSRQLRRNSGTSREASSLKRMDEGAKHTLPNMADRHTFTIACYDTTDTLVEVLETTFMPVVVQGHLSKVRVWESPLFPPDVRATPHTPTPTYVIL